MGRKAKARRRAERQAQRERTSAFWHADVPLTKRVIERALIPSVPAPVAEPRRPMITDAAIAFASATDDKLIGTPFTVARPAPGVVPEGAPVIATDDALGGIYGYAQAAGYSDGMQWLGYPYLAELAQRPEYRRISETIAKEMTRKWIKIQAQGDEKSEKVKQVEAALKKFHVQTLFRRATEVDGFFGRAQIYIDTGHTDDPDELKTPLTRRKGKIGKGALKRLGLVEPIWSYPTDYNADDPLHKDYYRPRSWYVQGKQVHGSRLLTFVAREVPDLLKPAYAFGGLSLSQIARPYVENWLRTRQSVSDLVHSFSVSGIKTNMQATLNDLAGGGDGLQRRVRLFNATRDNRGMMLIDKDTEEFFNVATPLGTLDHLQAQAQEQMASVSGIPLVVLLGITPSGLNASTDGEIKSFYAWIEAQQEQFFTDNLTKILEIVQLSEFGEIDPDISFRFEPLWALDEAAKATVRKTDADTDMEYVNGGVLSPLEVRQRLADSEESLYQGLDVEDVPEPPGGDPAQEGDPADPNDPHAPANENDPPPAQGEPDQPPVKGPPAKQAQDKEFSEADHPRGQPENAGEFASGGGGAGATKKPAAKSVQPKAPKGSPQYDPATTVSGGKTKSSTAKPAGQTNASPTSKAGLLPTKIEGKTRVQANGHPLPPHIQALKVPPGWADVKFNPDPKAALLATGKDAKGRPTAVYSEEFSAAQSAKKFARIHELMGKYKAIEKQNDTAKADPKTRDVADCLDLVMKMGVRPGSETDTGAKVQAYGATTLQGRHVVQAADGRVSLQFVGKKGVNLNLPVDDPDLAETLLARKAKAGASGKLFNGVSDKSLLDHTHTMDGGKFKTKDFRTHLGTSTAARLVKSTPPPTDAKSYKAAVMEIAKHVSAKLGNTPVIALQSYISPTVFSSWQTSGSKAA